MTPNKFVPRGAASFHVKHEGPAKDLYFLLLPKLTMLAFASAVEVLRVANQVTNKELYRWFLLSENGAVVRCSNGIEITPDSRLEDLPRGAMTFVCSGIEPANTVSTNVLAWVRRQSAFGSKFGGICTGAFALAKTGLLEGKRFTLHWENVPSFTEHYYDLQPTNNLYEIDGTLMTCGGGSAATDMMLEMIEVEHGKDLAMIVSDMCIHHRSNNRETPQKSAYSVALNSRNQSLINAMQLMDESIEDPLEIADIADRVKLSRRQLERLFKKYLNDSPNRYFIQLRVSRAYALLNETNMNVAQIAAATGFASATHLASRFRKRFGQSPTTFRRGWVEQPEKAP
ncbi:GlxA family transcriptional regulator [Octadecabacter ascidiaceicola]|uniref:HTH-type transcriptional regulator CdhR n=1 Tax=Octadecabacter ascidiaceicola TaxID=1655543 RepID=A0A238K3X4_9RHOB|nr:GlxA family transcriptional regulator [Octadecabacter ascidiaceicola]SMX37147.1 HTH-type transcriptional regulator CdhR [Octadecabacter ascidiaceicola]